MMKFINIIYKTEREYRIKKCVCEIPLNRHDVKYYAQMRVRLFGIYFWCTIQPKGCYGLPHCETEQEAQARIDYYDDKKFGNLKCAVSYIPAAPDKKTRKEK